MGSGGGEGDGGGSGGPATPGVGEPFGGGGSDLAARSLADGFALTTPSPSSGALHPRAAAPVAAAAAAEGEVSPLAKTAAGAAAWAGSRFDIDDCEECYGGCRCAAHVLWGRDKVALWNSSDYRSRWIKGIEATLSRPGK